MSYFVVVSIMTSVFSTFLDLIVGRVELPTCHVGGHGPKIPMSDLFVFGPHIHARSNAPLLGGCRVSNMSRGLSQTRSVMDVSSM